MTHYMTTTTNHAPTSNPKALAWVKEMTELCQPDRIHWVPTVRTRKTSRSAT